MRSSSVRQCKVGYRVQGRTRTLRSQDAFGRVLAQRRVFAQVSCPLIRLCGFWLEEAGFQVGDRLMVQVEDGQILLRREVSSDEMGVQEVGSGQVDGSKAGVGGLSLVEGRAEASRKGV